MVVEEMEPEGRAEGPMEDPLPPNLRLPRVLCNRLRFSFFFGGGGGCCPCDLDVDGCVDSYPVVLVLVSRCMRH